MDVSAYFTDPDGDPLSYAATSSSPEVATVSVSGGTVAVAAVASGMTNVTVTATDPGGLSATQTFRATVPNRAPVAGDSIPDIEVRAGDTVEVDVSGHFTDPDGDPLSYTAASSNSGVATVSVSGGTVAVAAVAKGVTNVTVTATDPGGLAATQTFRVTVPNRAPVAGDSIPDVEVGAGDTVEVDVSGHFTDPDGDPLSYSAASSNSGVATVSVSGGTVAVAAVAKGMTSVTVTATDPGGLAATQTFRVTVPNRAPVAGDSIPDVEVGAGDTVEVDVSGHFTDPDGDPLSYSAASSNSGVATVSVSGGTVAVAAVAKGMTSVTVTATDPGGLSATQTFRATVPNRAPEAGDPVPDIEVRAGDTVEVDVTGHFSDPDGDVLSYAAASSNSGVATVSVSGGTVAVAAVAKGVTNVTVTATDPGGLSATQTFQATVPNRAPVAGDSIPDVEVRAGDTVEVDVSGHFSDPDGDPLSYAAASSNSGVATVSVSGGTVAVAAVAKGVTNVTVTATDPGGLSATQTFQATVPNRAPVAGDSIPDIEVGAGDTVEVDVSGHFTDPDGDPLSYTAASSNSGVATVSVSGGGSTVAVAAVARGMTSVTVTATDPGGLSATQTFRATVPNRAPVAGDSIPDIEVRAGDTAQVDVSGHFTDPDGDPLSYAAASSSPEVATVSVSGGTVAVAAVAGGATSVTVTATDPGGLSATQTFRATVPNRAPVAGDSIPDIEVGAGDTVEVDVSGHFTDPDGDPLSYTAASSNSGVATVSVSGGTVAVAAVARGATSVTVTATDPGGLSATQTFRATVPNRAPVAGDSIPDIEVGAGDTVEVDVSGHFTDPDGDSLSYAAASSNPGVATVSVSGGTVAVAAVAGGMTTVTVTATDPGGLSATQTFQATVPNRAPVAGDPIPDIEVAGDTVEVDVSGHFTDPDGDPLSYTAASSSPEVATVSVSGGTLSVAGVGLDTTTLTVTATDPGGLSAQTAFGVTVRSPDRAVLEALYEATGGPNWRSNDGWLTDAPIFEWHGVSADETGRADSLGLVTNNLTGSIPPELGDLANLTVLDLGFNDLAGSIPPETGNLAALEVLDLRGNRLTGSIPPELGDLANLTVLDLVFNDLAGSIPPETGNLAALEVLDLRGNRLAGSIPPELGDLANLTVLDLGFNDLTGSIPRETGNLAALEVLDLRGNRLTGSIPPELGDLANLTVLDLGFNDLTGSIPSEIGDLAELEVLDLQGDDLTGSIPPELGDLANLTVLDLGFNDLTLTGSFPGWIADLADLTVLDLGSQGSCSRSSGYTGSVPAWLADLTDLTELDLGCHRLTGSIPPEFGNLANLEELDLALNELTGSIPPALGQLSKLKVLGLAANELSGSIPPKLGQLSKLVYLGLWSNDLSGPVSSDLDQLSVLVFLLLDDNELTDEFPASFPSLRSVEKAEWDGNAGLCAPKNDRFDAWLRGMRYGWSGPRCPEASHTPSAGASTSTRIRHLEERALVAETLARAAARDREEVLEVMKTVETLRTEIELLRNEQGGGRM